MAPEEGASITYTSPSASAHASHTATCLSPDYSPSALILIKPSSHDTSSPPDSESHSSQIGVSPNLSVYSHKNNNLLRWVDSQLSQLVDVVRLGGFYHFLDDIAGILVIRQVYKVLVYKLQCLGTLLPTVEHNMLHHIVAILTLRQIQCHLQ